MVQAIAAPYHTKVAALQISRSAVHCSRLLGAFSSSSPAAGRDVGSSPTPTARPRQEGDMVPSNDGDDVANTVREQQDDEALARELARQAHTLGVPGSGYGVRESRFRSGSSSSP